MPRDEFEAGDTLQFTWVSSVDPDAAPYFAVFGSGDALVSSQTAQTSGTAQYYAVYTMPSSSDGVYLWEWGADKTVAGTAYPFRKRSLFNVVRTRSETL
jgi:hypothetical protein